MRGTRMIPEADALFLHLATRRPLLEYTPARQITQGLILEAEKLTARPFCQLEYLLCLAESTAIVRLVKSAQNLRFLDLALSDSSSGILPALAHCTNLEKLSLIYGRDTYWVPEEIVFFTRHCSKIQHLQLRPYTNIARGPGIKDVHLKQIASNLPGLQYLWLGIHSQLTALGLFAMALHCTELKGCILRGKFDLRGLAGIKRQLFPCIKMLFFSSIVRDNEMTRETIEALIGRHAPQLRFFRGARDWHVNFASGSGSDVTTLWHPASIEYYWT